MIFAVVDLHSATPGAALGTAHEQATALPAVEAVRAALERARMGTKEMRRRLPKVWMQGAFEIEVIDLGTLYSMAGKTRKANLIRSLIACRPNPEAAASSQIIVHCHCVVDLADVDPEEYHAWIHKRWALPHQTRLSVTYHPDIQKLEKKLYKLASYCFKNRLEYNFSDETNGWEDSERIPYGELADMVHIYDELSGKGINGWLLGCKPKSES